MRRSFVAAIAGAALAVAAMAAAQLVAAPGSPSLDEQATL